MIIRSIAFFQIYGGILGIVALGLSFTSIKGNPLFLIGAVLYLYSIFCGYSLLHAGKYRIALSQFNQFLQILFFYMFGAGAYQYVSGGYLAVGLDNTTEVKFRFLFGLVSEFEFTIDESYPVNGVYLNVLALVCFFLLENYCDEDDLTLGDFIRINQSDIDLSD